MTVSDPPVTMSCSSSCDPTPRVVRVGSYTRLVSLITVEFICQHCGQPQSYTMYPGPTPKWCFGCYQEVRREQARLRKQRQRARQKAAQHTGQPTP